MDRRHDDTSEPRGYEPPEVEDLPAREGPAITAAGDSPPPDGPEWRGALESSPDDPA